MNKRPRILIVENRANWQTMLTTSLKAAGFDVEQAFHHGDALGCLRHQEFELVIIDLSLPGTMKQTRFEGEDILDELKTRGIFSIVVTGYSSVDINRKLEDKYGDYGLWAVVDKLRFADDETFLHDGFPKMIREALEEAREARRADGLSDDQLDRLTRVTPPTD